MQVASVDMQALWGAWFCESGHCKYALKENLKKGGITGYYSLEEERSQIRRQQNAQASSNKFLIDL